MKDHIERALTAKRESKYVDFKGSLDFGKSHTWCEVVKDIVAMANSGGGVLLVGLDNKGVPTGFDPTPILELDPAEVSDKVHKYTGMHFDGFAISKQVKSEHCLAAILVDGVSTPIVFTRPGTYPVSDRKQKTAFSAGTVYFRHGAKSEPGNTEDIRKVVERQLELVRKSWIKGVRKVVHAPPGSQTVLLKPVGALGSPGALPDTVRVVKDPTATPVLLTRDKNNTAGTFVHEEVSEGIFDEINNVIDANNILAK
jgi:hypothetical protein